MCLSFKYQIQSEYILALTLEFTWTTHQYFVHFIKLLWRKKKLLVPLTATKQSSWSLFKYNPRFVLLLLAGVCPVTQQEIFLKSKHLTFLRVNSILKETKYSYQRAALLNTNLWGNDAYLQLRAYILEACRMWGRT